MNHMEMLRQLIDSRCIQRGEFTLASGAKSNFYIDIRKLLKGDALEGVGFALWKTLFYAVKEYDAIGGMEAGAIPLTAAFLYYANQIDKRFADKLEGFYVRKQPKGHGTNKLIEGNLKPFSKWTPSTPETNTSASSPDPFGGTS